MKLYGTIPSHFTRKVRLVLQILQLDYEFLEVSNPMEPGPSLYANNPLQLIPILEDGNNWLIESDTICSYLIENYGKNSNLFPILNEQSKHTDQVFLDVINGVMSAAVKRIRAIRSRVQNIDQYDCFQKDKIAITSGFDWLESNMPHTNTYYPNRFSLIDISLLSLCEWAVFREQISNLDRYPKLQNFVESHHKSYINSHPDKKVN